MLRFSLLGSGSGGNALLVVSRHAKILIDAGLSFRQLEGRARAIGESLHDLTAVFVTHEHVDHVAGLGTLSRRLCVPIYMTPGTLASLPPTLGAILNLHVLEAGDAAASNGLLVRSFSVSHDAADPVGYVIECERAKLGLAMDLGRPSQLVRNRLAGVHALVLESNYCPELLRQGSYPPAVQQRIRGRRGHLSNAAMSKLLAGLLHRDLRLVVLVHISAENNDPDLAGEMARRVVRGREVEVVVARQDQPTPLFEVLP